QRIGKGDRACTRRGIVAEPCRQLPMRSILEWVRLCLGRAGGGHQMTAERYRLYATKREESDGSRCCRRRLAVGVVRVRACRLIGAADAARWKPRFKHIRRGDDEIAGSGVDRESQSRA